MELNNNNNKFIFKSNICFDDKDIGANAKVLSCGHLFHKDCVDKWLEQKYNCPNCRDFNIDNFEIKKIEDLKIFSNYLNYIESDTDSDYSNTDSDLDSDYSGTELDMTEFVLQQIERQENRQKAMDSRINFHTEFLRWELPKPI